MSRWEILTTYLLISFAAPSGSPETLSMCKILLELIHFLKFHDQPTVRRSCIYAVLTSLGNCIPGHFVVTEFSDQLSPINEWLSGKN